MNSFPEEVLNIQRLYITQNIRISRNDKGTITSIKLNQTAGWDLPNGFFMVVDGVYESG